MKVLYGKVLILFFIFITTMTGCMAGDRAEDGQTSSEEGSAAKSEIQARLDAQVNFMNQENEKNGYIKGDDFPHFRNELNLMSTAVNIEDRLETNNDEEINNLVSTLQAKVGNLSSEEAVTALEKLNSSDLIYTIAFQDDLEYAFTGADVAGSESSFNFFITQKSEELTEESEILEEIDSTIGVIEFTTLGNLKALKNEAEFYGEYFAEEELTLLNTAIDGLTSSVNKQIDILEQLKPGAISEGQSADELLDEAVSDYQDAEVAVGELEDRYGLTS